MTNTPAHGLRHVVRGLRLISRPGLRRFVAVPFAINTLLFAAVLVLGGEHFSSWLERLLPAWLDWLSWLLVPLFGLAMLIVTFYTFTMVANLLAAPFNSLLAARIERHLTGRNPGAEVGGSGGFVREVASSIRSELHKLGYFLVRALPLLLLFLIPGVNLLAPLLWIAFSAWFLALEYGDFPLGNRPLNFSEQRRLQARRRWEALGLGGGILVLTLIPVVNFIAVPVGVAAATAMWVDLPSESRPHA